MRGGHALCFFFLSFFFLLLLNADIYFVSLSLRYVPVPVQQPVAVAAPGSFYAAPSAYGSGVYRSGSFYQAQFEWLENLICLAPVFFCSADILFYIYRADIYFHFLLT
jgi:hypothetical protein